MKTVKKHLEDIPEVYRELVLEEMKKQNRTMYLSCIIPKLSDAIFYAFSWGRTGEGWDFWNGIYEECLRVNNSKID
jgi:hypothetical protein